MKRRQMIGGSAATLIAGFSAWPSYSQNKNQPKLLGYLRTNWSQDPYSYGTYSHLAKGSSQKDYKILAKPVARKLYFAGEAANPERNSSVHSALESGTMVAAKLVRQKHQRIGIIGAGIAGLSAAKILHQAGRQVKVMEGRNRIGGRIHTDRSLGLPCDLGASWLHGTKGNPLTKIVEQIGMRTVISKPDWIVMGNGQQIPDSQVPPWLEEIAGYNNTAGTSRDSMNLWGYMSVKDYSGDELLFPDGYGQVLDAFNDGYDLKLNDTVKAIDYSGADVRILSQNTTQTFDAVIVTVPLGVLKTGQIAFIPNLPSSTRKAIQRLGFGTLDKIYLLFDKVFWDKKPHNILTPLTGFEPGFFNSWVNLYPTLKKPVLLCFNGGPAALALSSEPDSAVVGNARNTILKAYGRKS